MVINTIFLGLWWIMIHGWYTLFGEWSGSSTTGVIGDDYKAIGLGNLEKATMITMRWDRGCLLGCFLSSLGRLHPCSYLWTLVTIKHFEESMIHCYWIIWVFGITLTQTQLAWWFPNISPYELFTFVDLLISIYIYMCIYICIYIYVYIYIYTYICIYKKYNYKKC